MQDYKRLYNIVLSIRTSTPFYCTMISVILLQYMKHFTDHTNFCCKKSCANCESLISIQCPVVKARTSPGKKVETWRLWFCFQLPESRRGHLARTDSSSTWHLKTTGADKMLLVQLTILLTWPACIINWCNEGHVVLPCPCDTNKRYVNLLLLKVHEN